MTVNVKPALRGVVTITFFTFAARGLVLPFLNLYLKSLGFSATTIGIINSLTALAQLLFTPLLHTWVDRLGRHRRLYRLFLVSNAASLIGIIASTSIEPLLGLFVITRDLSDNPSASLLAQLTVTWLNERGLRLYGQIRAWGSFGWAVTTMVSGRIIALGGYPLLFVLAAITNLVLQKNLGVLPERTNVPHNQPTGWLIKRPKSFYVLAAVMFLFVMGAGAISGFSYIFFKEYLKASPDMIGIASSIAALSEIPAMVMIDRYLTRKNTLPFLSIGLAGQAAVWWGFTILPNQWWLIPLMVVRGTFYSCHAISLTLLVSNISDSHNAATNQAVIQATLVSVAVFCTGFMSGWLFDNMGPHTLFSLASVCGFFAVGLLLIMRKTFDVTSAHPA